MKIGTKSLLFGAHQFAIHPVMIFRAWVKLYGFPWDPRLWLAFLVHDWGYWGCADMDGPEGEKHVEVGARIMGWLFGPQWYEFMITHSRFYSRKLNKPISRLCVADKYVIVATPWWLYVPFVRWTGEIREFQKAGKHVEELGHTATDGSWKTDREWFARLQALMIEFTANNQLEAQYNDEARFYVDL